MAVEVLAGLLPQVTGCGSWTWRGWTWQGAELWISRSGYTGEDGFEISVPLEAVEAFARALLDNPAVAPIGLGARDTLRLEAGLPLYGQDLGADITPVEAGLNWAIQKVRRPGGARAGGYPGADVIAAQLADGAPRRRVGLLPEGPGADARRNRGFRDGERRRAGRRRHLGRVCPQPRRAHRAGACRCAGGR
jgi:aminomethyltransferase